MDYLGARRMFVRAVEAGSFSKAAIATNTKTSTVSRAIASLEEDLGVSLFHRATRRAHLSEPGATFYEHAPGVLQGPEEVAGCGLGNGGAATGIDPVLFPTWLVGEEIKADRLRHVLPEWSSMTNTKPSGIFGIFPPHRGCSIIHHNVVRALRDADAVVGRLPQGMSTQRSPTI
jgi:DNA-binding transcriptional LysR family regulator